MMFHSAEPCRIVSGAFVLEGRFSAGQRGAAVVAPPHPLAGGTIDNPVVAATAAALAQASMATLAFNYRGVEGSTGHATDSLPAAVEDYTSALAELASRCSGPYYAAGYSFGAGTALLTARTVAELAGVILVAPPLGMLHAEDMRAFTGRVLVVVGDADEYAPLPELRATLVERPDAELVVLAGADHFFHFGGLSQLTREIARRLGAWTAG